ncbi:hypothetical protein FOA43_004003 [Brettanomyces nanus]|uniref:Peroxisomal ATPase PEX6 n=1 Tax=Eeniella nana TaxID=13502 RepID=A0A875S4P7_EENNA|nr:uncharacterized protein FOA43_004003 [Brettanomyces nanus]QPG76611.1 hypothetical protein FOA43_004003 [Brettanomyces nanus]
MPDRKQLMNSKPVEVGLRLSVNPEESMEFLALNRKLLDYLYPGGADDIGNRHVSMRCLASQILCRDRIYSVEVNDDLSDNTVQLHSLPLLQRYGDNFSVDQCMVRPIEKIIHLDSIVMEFPSEVYLLLQRYSREKIVDIMTKETGSGEDMIIVHRGDWIRSLHGNIIHCEPVEQGYLDMNTDIIVVKEKLKLKPKSETEAGDSTKSIDSMDPFNINPTEGLIAMNSGVSPDTKFMVASLSRNTIENFTGISSMNDTGNDDDQSFVCLSSNDMSAMGVLSGDIIMLSVKSTNYSIYIKAIPFIDPNGFKQHTVYCSPVLLLNLGWPDEVTLQVLPKEKTGTDKIEELIPVATSVVLARVASPPALDRTLQQGFLSNLKLYFEKYSRVVRINQYIPIPISSDIARIIFSTYDGSEQSILPKAIPDASPDTLVWFKVTGGSLNDHLGNEIELQEGQNCVVKPESTHMTQAGVVKESIPLLGRADEINTYLGLESFFEYLSTHEAGSYSFQYASRLKRIIDTAFKVKSQIPLETTILLSSTSRCMGKSSVIRSITAQLDATLLELDCYQMLNSSSVGKTIGVIRGKADRVVENCAKLVIFFRHVEALCKKSELQQQQPQKRQSDSLSLKLAELTEEYSRNGAVVVFSTNDSDAISEILRSRVKFEITVTVPNDLERRHIFQYLISKFGHSDKNNFDLGDDVSFESLAMKSAGLSLGDLNSVVQDAGRRALDEMEQLSASTQLPLEQIVALNGGSIKITATNYEEAMNSARDKNSDAIGAPKIPDVKWEDIGGLENVKGEILDTIDMPLKHPELFGDGMKKRSGIMFYGPPGTGKTLLAKAIATNFALNFFSVKGPELLNMYIGESEANVRRVFQKARDAKPCVIFFDELDSVAPKRGNQGDSGGVMDRIVSQLLAELDGMSSGDAGEDGVFIVGATNRPDLLDEALLRPGRFDKMLYLGISDTHDKQAKIIRALTRKFELAPDFDPLIIASNCPFNYTGADFYAMCSDAMLNAMIRTAGAADAKIKEYNERNPGAKDIGTRYWFDHLATEKDLSVTVGLEDFDKARKELIASVSAEELRHYVTIKQGFEGNKKELHDQ